MSETIQPIEETPAVETAATAGETPELIEETRDRNAQRRPDPSGKPRKAPEGPKAPPWFLHPEERRSFKLLAQTSRELSLDMMTATGPMERDTVKLVASQVEQLAATIERCLEADEVMQRENLRLTKESAGLLDTVARWQDYGEGRIPQPPGDAKLPELPDDLADGVADDGRWEALYRVKASACAQCEEELAEARQRISAAHARLNVVETPPSVSYVVNFIAGREPKG